MFDQNSNQPSDALSSQPQKQSAPPGNLPGAPKPPQVEDIFSETEVPSAARISRPIQPGQASQMQASGDIYGGRSIMDNKMLLVLLSIIGLLVIGAGVWGAVYYFSKTRDMVPANINNNLNTEVNTNTAVDTNVNTEINTNEDINTNADLITNENINAVNANTSVGIDSDNDGLSDEEEKQLGTNHNNFDTDGDGLVDRVEVKIYHSDPLKKDTDGDGYNDGDEVINGYDPIKIGGARLFDVP